MFVPHSIKHTRFSLTSLLFIISLIAQAHVSPVSGTVTDMETSKPIEGATIMILEGKFGGITNKQGKFNIYFEEGEYELRISALGYKPETRTIVVDTIGLVLNIALLPATEELEEVMVSASKQEQLKKVESISIQLIEEEFFKESMAGDLMQSLQNIPGVNAMNTGTGLSKPMIRGMSYYRVVMAQNGIKQEGQQWSNHHGISIDENALGHVEIIKGPASLQYGSDAIGGVINVLPPHVPLSSGMNGQVTIIAKTNTNWLGSSLNISGRKGDFYSLISLAYNNYTDFKVPDTEFFLTPSATTSEYSSHQVPLSGTVVNTAGSNKTSTAIVGIIKPWGNSYFEISYVGNSTGFFDWQGLQNDSLRKIQQEHKRDLNLPWQNVDNVSINQFTNRFIGENKLEIALGFQNNISKEYGYLDDRTGNRYEELVKYRSLNNLDLQLKLRVYSAHLFYTINSRKKQTWKIGWNSQLQNQKTDGYNHILPEYNRYSAGMFLIYKYKLSKKWIVNSGARFDINSYSIDQSLNPDPEFGDSIFNNSLRKTYNGTAFSGGINFIPNKTTTFKINMGKSYRIPSVYELSAYGLHRHGGRFEKGNEDNKPEQAVQIDLGIEKKWKYVQVSLSPFANYFLNYLYLTPTSTLRPEGQIYQYNQTHALLWGGEMSMTWQLWKPLEIKVGAEYVYAVNLDETSALPFTPPLNSTTEIQYSFKDLAMMKSSSLGIQAIACAPQNFTVPNELSTPGYICLNMKAKTTFDIGKTSIKIVLKANNLLNSKYYNHISFYRKLRIPEQSRNIQIGISAPF